METCPSESWDRALQFVLIRAFFSFTRHEKTIKLITIFYSVAVVCSLKPVAFCSELHRELQVRFVERPFNEVVHELQLGVFLEIPVEAERGDFAVPAGAYIYDGVIERVVADDRLNVCFWYAL